MTDFIKERKEQIEGIDKTFERNVSQIEKCLEKGLNEASIVIMVSVFETFLKDVFILCKSNWFQHTGEIVHVTKRIDTRKSIYKYLNKIKAFDEFLKTLYIYSGFPSKSNDSDITSLYEVLFKKGREKINFQNLKSDDGVKVAYKTFLGIDIPTLLDENESTSDRMWEKLNELFDERHEIVHKGKKTEFSEEDIRKVLDSIKYLKGSLSKSLIQKEYYG